jgi:hypothetical protein
MAETITVQLDKLSVINNALIQTGNAPVTFADGSDAWIAGSNAYDRLLPVVMSKHNWKFETKIAPLVSQGVSAFPGYSTIFAMPADCLQLIDVWDNYYASLVLPSLMPGNPAIQTRPPAFDYKLIGGQVHCTPQASGVSALYMPFPEEATSVSFVGFVETLTNEVAALLSLSLNEDASLAAGNKALAKESLMEARSRDTQQEPRRVPFRSRMLEVRRNRNWGGW